MTNLYSILKKQRHHFADKGPYSQIYGFSSSHVWLWELDHQESWAPKDWCFWTVVLEKTFESPLDCKENKSVNPKGNWSWIFIGRADAEAEAPKLWPLMWKGDTLEKFLMLGKTECRRRRRQQKMRLLDSITDSMDMSLSKLCTALHGVTKSGTWLSEWTSTKTILKKDSQGEVTFVFRSRKYEPGIFK